MRFAQDSDYAAPNLRAVLADPARLKLFHFARFDLAAISHYLNVVATPVFCTKIASRLTRTYTDRHGLKELVKEMLGTDISKQQQSSDWGGATLSEAQKDYAASDVRYLHRLHAEFVVRLEREGAPRLHRPVSTSCPTAPTSIWRDGRKSTYSATVKVQGRYTVRDVETCRSRTNTTPALGHARRSA